MTIRIYKKAKAQLKRVKIIKKLHLKKSQNYNIINQFKNRKAI